MSDPLASVTYVDVGCEHLFPNRFSSQGWHRGQMTMRFRRMSLCWLAFLVSSITALQENESCDARWADDFVEVRYTDDQGDVQSFLAYREPNVTQFYHRSAPLSSERQTPSSPSRLVKIMNLDQWPQGIYVVSEQGPTFLRQVDSLSARAISINKGSKIFLVMNHGPSPGSKRPTKRFVVTDDQLYVWDPYYMPEDQAKWHMTVSEAYPDHELQKIYYDLRKTVDFSAIYEKSTGRTYLSNWNRNPPIHTMHRADYFGQQYSITTNESYFHTIPSAPDRMSTLPEGGSLEDTHRFLSSHRVDGELQLNMTVISCAPKVFEIPGFLSDAEADHLVHLGREKGFQRSRTGNGAASGEAMRNSRTSSNAWLSREDSAVVNAIYKRAADLMNIDELLFREHFLENQRHDSAAEPLQVVHYKTGQEYSNHFDFGFPPIRHKDQSTRFATLLLYLNDDFEGGETIFPLWANSDTTEGLEVKPKKGKAILFYSMLPDGNMDRLSLHASKPVIEGEKLLANLWVWDPTVDLNVL